MDSTPNPKIRSLAKLYQPGCTLPAEFYLSDDVFSVDMDVFFNRHWVLVGVAGDVPNLGDVHVVEIGDASLLILRDETDEIRCFHNVCQHRGARLVDEDQSALGRIVCRYHQWSYGLDGELKHAAHMGQGFDKSCRGLKAVHLRVISGLIYVCLAEKPPQDIDVVEQVLKDRLNQYELQNAKIAFDSVICENGNWKLSVDNNRECYHCEGSHPELGNTLVSMDIGFDPAEVSKTDLKNYQRHLDGTAQARIEWSERGFDSSPIERYSGCETMLRTERFVLEGAGESHTKDGAAACIIPLGQIESLQLGDMHVHTHNSWMHIFGDHAIISFIIPLAPDKTELRTIWLVHPEAQEGIDYDLGRLTEVWIATNRQDAELVEMTQRGVRSVAYEPGPLSDFCEATVEKNTNWYIERLEAHGFGV